MKRILLPLLLLAGLPARSSFSQTPAHDAALAAVATFFEGFAAQDSTLMWSVTDRSSRVVITGFDENGDPSMRTIPIGQFIPFVATQQGEKLNETFWDPHVDLDDNLATVWISYNFWVGETLDHCGKDSFQLARTTDGWKIVAIADTQRRDGCVRHFD